MMRFAMKKLSNLIVSRRNWILGVMICLTLVCAILSTQVKINYDMTKYLPDDSAMKKGMDIMNAEFPSMGGDKSIRVMAEGLDEAKQAELLDKELTKALMREISRLEPKKRQAIIMRYGREMKTADIAVSMNMNHSTLRRMLQSALAELRKKLEGYRE